MSQYTFVRLAQWLYPKGRAFRVPEPTITGGVYTTEDGSEDYTTEDGSQSYTTEESTSSGGILWRLHNVLGGIFNQVWTDAGQILNDMLPDNPNFDINDAHDWYRRLGLYDSGLVALSDMKLAIAQKLSFPYVPLNKQNYLFVQQQLQAAGFNVFVYENRFLIDGVYKTQTPDEVIGALSDVSEYGNFEYGQQNFGGGYHNKIVNYIEDERDAAFNIGDNYRSTFFIGGSPIGTFADVPEVRHDEFRQLILTFKPAQMVGYLFVNYV